MVKHRLQAVALCAAAVSLGGCELSKSSNPLSPTVAGPIPGVNITSPAVFNPTAGAKIAVDSQPITLMVSNATTNGVRPLSYLFEVATDPDFANKVFARDGVSPGTDGKTSLRLPDALATGRSYYWRARAQDGANTGPFTAASFAVFTPIVIGVPTPVAPSPNATVDSIRPSFVIGPAPRSGPVGQIAYQVQIGDSDSFGNQIAIFMQNEQANQTTMQTPLDLAYSHVYYWRVRAADPTTVGGWSGTLAFQTPAQPVVVAPPPTPSPSGPAPGDALNLAQAGVYNSPPDIASWPATGTITSLTMSPSAGLSFQFTTQNSWPDVIPPGFSGALQYTVWAVVNVGGQWYTSGFIQMWRGRPSTGAPIISQFPVNWAYDSRWGPMAGHQPQPGEQMGFFLSAGNARGQTTVSSVRERTNVVLVSLPAGDSGNFSFSVGTMPFFSHR